MTLAYRGMDLRPGGATLAPMTPRRAHLALGLFVLVAMLSLTWPLSVWFAEPLPLVLGLPRGLFTICCWAAATFVALLAYDRVLSKDREQEDA
jgi:hypothetical protein